MFYIILNLVINPVQFQLILIDFIIINNYNYYNLTFYCERVKTRILRSNTLLLNKNKVSKYLKLTMLCTG